MARKPRIQYEGAAYHVMSRGNGGADIFLDDSDRRLFLDTLDEVCRRMAWEIHAFVAMSNHYHLLIVTPQANLVLGMKWFQGAFTQRINARHQRGGHLFQGRYRAQNIDPDGVEGSFRRVGDYIHLNPARVGLVGKASRRKGKRLEEYPWSSLPLYLGRAIKRPDWLVVERVLGGHRLADDGRGRRRYRDYLEKRSRQSSEETDAEDEEIRAGWFIGGETFAEALLERLVGDSKARQRGNLSGGAVRRVDERQARQLVRRGAEALGIEGKGLKPLAKNDPRKQGLAWLVRSNTSVSNQWVSECLGMGDPANVSRAVRRFRESNDATTRSIKKKVTA